MQMIPIQKIKEKMGAEAEELSDQQIESLRDTLCQIAEVAFDSWIRNKQTFQNGPENNVAIDQSS